MNVYFYKDQHFVNLIKKLSKEVQTTKLKWIRTLLKDFQNSKRIKTSFVPTQCTLIGSYYKSTQKAYILYIYFFVL